MRKGNERACTTSAASVGLVPVSVVAITISAAIAAAAGAAVIASAAAASSVTNAAAASECSTTAISLREKIPGVLPTWHYESKKELGSIIGTDVTCSCR